LFLPIQQIQYIMIIVNQLIVTVNPLKREKMCEEQSGSGIRRNIQHEKSARQWPEGRRRAHRPVPSATSRRPGKSEETCDAI
jgi:hypothetical protein